MAGNVGPPRNPLLNATASRASLTNAIRSSWAGPYAAGSATTVRICDSPENSTIGATTPTALKTSPATRARSTSRPSNRPKIAAAARNSPPATRARTSPSRPKTTTRTTSDRVYDGLAGRCR